MSLKEPHLKISKPIMILVHIFLSNDRSTEIAAEMMVVLADSGKGVFCHPSTRPEIKLEICRLPHVMQDLDTDLD